MIPPILGTVVLVPAAFAAGGAAGAKVGRVAQALPGYVSADIGLLAAGLAFLVPAGLIMIAMATSDQSRVASVAAAGFGGLAIGTLAYACLGFGLQFGGLGLISDVQGASALMSEWSPLDIMWGPGWGIIGLGGFFLRGGLLDSEVGTVILYGAALSATAACIPMLALARRLGFGALLALGLFAALIFPAYGNWLWGGGFLYGLGGTVRLGHGVVDFAGSGGVHALAGFFTLAALLALRPRSQVNGVLPGPLPVHSPSLAVVGAFLALAGWFGLAIGNPLVGGSISYSQVLLNILLSAAAGALVASMYGWLVRGGPDLAVGALGLVAGLVAASASCPFVSPWGAVAIGAVAGLLLPLCIHLLQARLPLGSVAAPFAVHGISGLWGLLALGVFANGGHGQGWNGVGATQYVGVPGQGVSGLLVGSGLQPDWPGQAIAQLVGFLALIVVAVGVWAVIRSAKGFFRWATAVDAKQHAEPGGRSGEDRDDSGQDPGVSSP
jgi:Amt family ammonium transporter